MKIPLSCFRMCHHLGWILGQTFSIGKAEEVHREGRGEAWASAACPHSPQGHALPSWTRSLGGRNGNVLQARSRGGGKRLLRLPREGSSLTALPGSLSSTFSPCGLPAPAVNLCSETLKECNYFPEQAKQRRLPSSGMCEDTARRWQREIAAGLLIQTWIFPPLPPQLWQSRGSATPARGDLTQRRLLPAGFGGDTKVTQDGALSVSRLRLGVRRAPGGWHCPLAGFVTGVRLQSDLLRAVVPQGR